jgi:hypothetical protein
MMRRVSFERTAAERSAADDVYCYGPRLLRLVQWLRLVWRRP